MLKFVKWTLIFGGSGALLLYLIFGANTPSYIKTAIGSARQSIKAAIPIDFEIRRSERLIKQIAPQIQESLRDVALGEVELEELQDDIKRLESRENKLHAGLLRRKSMLETGEPAYYIAGISMERSRLEVDLERVFDDFRNVKSLIDGKEKIMKSQRKALVAAKRKLEAVMAERSRLKDMLRNLKAQKRQVEALAAQSRKFDLDDSSLVRARLALKEAKKRLDVTQRMLEANLIDYTGLAELNEPVEKRNILLEVNKYLGQKEDAVQALPGRNGKIQAIAR